MKKYSPIFGAICTILLLVIANYFIFVFVPIVYRYLVFFIVMLVVLGIAFYLFAKWFRVLLEKPIEDIERQLYTNQPVKAQDIPVHSPVFGIAQALSQQIQVNVAKANNEVIADNDKDRLTGIRTAEAMQKEFIKLDEQVATYQLSQVGIIRILLTNITQINNDYGSERGDIAIKKLCRTICNIFDHSPVFRSAGGEFTVVLLGHDYSIYEKLLARLQDAAMQYHQDAGLKPWEKMNIAHNIAFLPKETAKSMNVLFTEAKPEISVED